MTYGIYWSSILRPLLPHLYRNHNNWLHPNCLYQYTVSIVDSMPSHQATSRINAIFSKTSSYWYIHPLFYQSLRNVVSLELFGWPLVFCTVLLDFLVLIVLVLIVPNNVFWLEWLLFCLSRLLDIMDPFLCFW